MSAQPTLEPIPYAVTTEGETLTFNPSIDGHFLVVGAVGSGKTAMMTAIIRRAAAQGARVWVCDPLRTEFADLASWPNVEAVASTVDDITQIIHTAHRAMEQRLSALMNGAVTRADLEPICVVLNEPRRMSGDADPRQLASLDRKAEEITRIGRSVRIHLVAGTSYAPPRVLAAFPIRCSLGRFSRKDSSRMWGSPEATDHVEGRGPGVGTAYGHGGPTAIRVLAEDSAPAVTGRLGSGRGYSLRAAFTQAPTAPSHEVVEPRQSLG